MPKLVPFGEGDARTYVNPDAVRYLQSSFDAGKSVTLIYFEGKHYLQVAVTIEEAVKALKMFDADG
jgi:hypothetical protein